MGKKFIRLPLKKEHRLHERDLNVYSGEIMSGINEMVEFFTQKVFIISFGQVGLMFLLCFFCLFTGKYKTGWQIQPISAIPIIKVERIHC